MSEGIGSRPITDDDKPLLRRIYASTRADEMAMAPWSEAEKAAFVSSQFGAQHTYYLCQHRRPHQRGAGRRRRR